MHTKILTSIKLPTLYSTKIVCLTNIQKWNILITYYFENKNKR